MRLVDAKLILLGLLLTAISAGFVAGFYSSTQHACLDCRVIRTTRTYCGVPMFETEAYAYSHAYLSMHSSHKHQWRWCGSIQTYSWNGVIRACGRQHPIWHFPVRLHAKYASLVSPTQLEATLRVIDGPDRDAAVEEAWRAAVVAFDAP